MLNLNEIKQDHQAATTPVWWGRASRGRATARLLEQIPALVAELTQAREELAAVDASLGDFYAPILDPETEEPCGSFWKDHGIWVLRDALELAQTRLRHVQAEHDTLSALLPLYYAVDEYLDYPTGYLDSDRLAALRKVFLGMSADVPPAIDEEEETQCLT